LNAWIHNTGGGHGLWILHNEKSSDETTTNTNIITKSPEPTMTTKISVNELLLIEKEKEVKALRNQVLVQRLKMAAQEMKAAGYEYHTAAIIQKNTFQRMTLEATAQENQTRLQNKINSLQQTLDDTERMHQSQLHETVKTMKLEQELKFRVQLQTIQNEWHERETLARAQHELSLLHITTAMISIQKELEASNNADDDKSVAATRNDVENEQQEGNRNISLDEDYSIKSESTSSDNREEDMIIMLAMEGKGFRNRERRKKCSVVSDDQKNNSILSVLDKEVEDPSVRCQEGRRQLRKRGRRNSEYDHDAASEVSSAHEEHTSKEELTQRKKKGKLDSSLERQLKKIGNMCSFPAGTWVNNYRLLVKFQRREGHCHVPQSHKEDGMNLGFWLKNQRRRKTKGKLESTCEKQLEEIGVVLNVRSEGRRV